MRRLSGLRRLWVVALVLMPVVICAQARAEEAVAAEKTDLEPGLLGEYFKFNDGETVDFLPADTQKAPAAKSVDSQIAFRTDEAGFGAAPFSDNLYVRWTGSIEIGEDGKVSFFLGSDDGSRLFVDGNLIVDNPGMHGMEEKTADVEMKAGMHDIKVEFYQGGGPGEIALSWQAPGKAKEKIPANALFHKSSPELKAELTTLSPALLELRKQRLALATELNEKRSAVDRIRQKIASEDPGMLELGKARQEAEAAYGAKLDALMKENAEVQALLPEIADAETKLQKFGEETKTLSQPAPEAPKQ